MHDDDKSSEVYFYLLGAKVFYTIVSLCGAVGVMSNSVLLYTTICTKSLRAPCNILVGACALFDIVHQLGAFLQIIQLFRDELTSSLICSSLLFLPEMGIAAGAFTMVSIGVDRFISIAMPNQYRTMNKIVYLMLQFATISAFCAFNAFLIVYFYRDHDLICNIPAVFHDNGVVWWAYSGAAVHALAFILYFLTWRFIKAQGEHNSLYQNITDAITLTENLEVEKLARIFRTILLVTIFDLGGFALTQTLMATQNLIEMPGVFRNTIVVQKDAIYRL